MNNKRRIELPAAIFLLGIVFSMGITFAEDSLVQNGALTPELQGKYDQLNQLLDQKLIDWKPKEYSKMVFSAHHLLASENMIESTDGSYDLPFLEVLKETGVDSIRISIYPYNYEKYKERYEALIAKIKEDKLKLMVAYMVGNVSMESFDEYKKMELNFTEMFVKKYRPDYYAVVTEPITMEKRIKLGSRVSDGQWIELVKETSKLVKNINPGTKTMAAVNVEEGQLDLAKKFALIESLDVVAFQLYGLPTLELAEEAINFAETQGKETWITETWLGLPTIETWEGSKRAGAYFNYPFMAPLHAKWLKVITYYGQKHKMEGVAPFFTLKFVFYPGTDDPTVGALRGAEAFKNNERTEPFFAYKEVIKEVRSNAK